MVWQPFGKHVPAAYQTSYRVARILLELLLLAIAIHYILSVIYPTLSFSFDFRAPNSLKNNLDEPRLADGSPLLNGKVAAGNVLFADLSAFGNFSQAEAEIDLAENSDLPKELTLSLRRSYRSFFYPTGEPVKTFPQAVLYRVSDTYYELRENILYPFVSAEAFHSRYPESLAQTSSDSLLQKYPVSDQWLGYRVGSLLGFADGVFIVTSETEVRPIASASIFLALGYDFKDVKPVSEEEMGVYKRGRIILRSIAHPDGTILLSKDDGSYLIIENKEKRPLLPSAYRDFLLQEMTPIVVSEGEGNERAECAFESPAGSRKLTCRTPLVAMADNFGDDYELQIKNIDRPLSIDVLSLSLSESKNKENLFSFLIDLRNRIYSRFNYAPQP